MILVDTSGLLDALDEDSPRHDAVRSILGHEAEPPILSPFVLGELDYMLATRVGQRAELALLAEVAEGAYRLVEFGPDDVAAARRVIARHRDLRIGLADASIVVLAGRFRTHRVLTLDERHFRALRTPTGRPFTVLPADA